MDAAVDAATDAAEAAIPRPAFCDFPVTVSRVERLSEHFTRITFSGSKLEYFGTEGLDQRLKVCLPLEATGFATFPQGEDWYLKWRELPEAHRNPFRTYTIRAVRASQREVDVDFVAHGDGGPASAWAMRAAAGDEAILIGPDERAGHNRVGIEWNPGSASTLLLAGDETAAPAICAIVESLPADAKAQVFIEIPAAGDELTVNAPANVTVTWLPRANASSGYGELLVETVREWATRSLRPTSAQATRGGLSDIDVDREILWEVPENDATDTAGASSFYAWIAGESAAVKSIRRFLVSELGIDRSSVAFMGYWRLGKAEA